LTEINWGVASQDTNRTCEIGLAHHSGVPYRSIMYLVEACARPRPGQVAAEIRRD
jgi:D-lactate dehydrogenase